MQSFAHKSERTVIQEANDQLTLVRLIQESDQQAKLDLVGRYGGVVLMIMRREVRDAATAEDLYQETFRIVFEKIMSGDVREPEKLSGFICSVARNLALYYFRRAARRKEIGQLDEAALHACPGLNQFQQLLQKENAALIRKILRLMPNERDRQALFRFYIANHERKQICADLGFSPPHFNHVLHRARRQFRKLYEQALRKNEPAK
jgi:RNA polymerase sigma-70 factor, ECF subfamily